MTRSVHEAVRNKLVFSRRAEKLAQALDSLIPVTASILDVGCGNGVISWKLGQLSPSRDLAGIEVVARESCMIPCRMYDGNTIPFSPDTFDYVLFVDVLHHSTAGEDLLRQAKLIARRGIVIKDHYCESRLDHYTLAFMDWVGNAHYGIMRPNQYKAIAEWREMFVRLGLRQTRTVENVGLYPPPFDAVFGKKMHFVSLLEKL